MWRHSASSPVAQGPWVLSVGIRRSKFGKTPIEFANGNGIGHRIVIIRCRLLLHWLVDVVSNFPILIPTNNTQQTQHSDNRAMGEFTPDYCFNTARHTMLLNVVWWLLKYNPGISVKVLKVKEKVCRVRLCDIPTQIVKYFAFLSSKPMSPCCFEYPEGANLFDFFSCHYQSEQTTCTFTVCMIISIYHCGLTQWWLYSTSAVCEFDSPFISIHSLQVLQAQAGKGFWR